MDRSETVDRALLGTCAVVWLAVIGVSVAAMVALVELAAGRAGDPAPDSGTPWGLYVVIGVSAVIILASIPLLLRARRAAQEPPLRTPPPARSSAAPAVEPPTEKLRVFGTVTEPARTPVAGEKRPPPPSPYGGTVSDDIVEAMWLRFTLSWPPRWAWPHWPWPPPPTSWASNTTAGRGSPHDCRHRHRGDAAHSVAAAARLPRLTGGRPLVVAVG